MNFARTLFFVAGLGTMAALPTLGDTNARLGQKVENFQLRDFRGKEHSLDELASKKLVVIAYLGTECPLAKLYAPRLAELAKTYDSKGVAFLGLSSNQQDSATELLHYARVHHVEFPILKDLSNVVADKMKAERTPEVFLLDENRVVRYVGRIDDQYGFTPSGGSYMNTSPKRRDLQAAIDELLAGKPVSQPSTKVAGCLIGRVKDVKGDSSVTYASHVASIFNARCVECHRAGQIAPFPLRNYQEVVGWAEMIREVVNDRRMPPWHADPKFGRFANDCRLSNQEVDLINRWVEAGAPEGDPKAMPTPPSFTEGWHISKPDQIIIMADKPFMVPAEGTVDYQRFTIDPGWKEDKWIKEIECRPGNPAVVHHIILYIRPPAGPRNSGAGRLTTDWLGAFAPGLRQPTLPEGVARYAPAGSQLVFEVHYTPNGTAQEDLSRVGLVFADPKTVKQEIAVKNAGNFNFKIPANDDNYLVESSYTFRQPATLVSVSPHMHLRGKDFRYDLVYPDGKKETILWVPRYDFGWQTTYIFSEPMKIPKGTVMQCYAHFDNSEGNLANPDPSKDVRWGEQTWEEMMFGWFEMTLTDQDLTKPAPPPGNRVKEFVASWGLSKGRQDSQLLGLAKESLGQDTDAFVRFGHYLKDQAPQLDRLDITFIDDDSIHLRAVAEFNGFKSGYTSSSTVLPVQGNSLAEAAHAEKPTVFADINKAGGGVMRRMYIKGIRSSAHVPVVIDGKKGTLNAWSTDPAAFPSQAIELLAPLAQQITEQHRGAKQGP